MESLFGLVLGASYRSFDKRLQQIQQALYNSLIFRSLGEATHGSEWDDLFTEHSDLL